MFNAQELANTSWAFARVNLSDENLFAAVARAAERRVHKFNVQNLSNTPWAFATTKAMDHQDHANTVRAFPTTMNGTVFAQYM